MIADVLGVYDGQIYLAGLIMDMFNARSDCVSSFIGMHDLAPALRSSQHLIHEFNTSTALMMQGAGLVWGSCDHVFRCVRESGISGALCCWLSVAWAVRYRSTSTPQERGSRILAF